MVQLTECAVRFKIHLLIVFLFISVGCTETPASTTEAVTEIPVPQVTANALPQTWIPRHDMPTPRSEMPAAELNRLIYVVGGYGPVPGGLANGKDVVTTFEAYDPKADQWISLAP